MKKLSIILIAFLSFSCSKEENTEETFETDALKTEITLNDAQYKNAGIQVAEPSYENLSSKITVTGVIDVPPQNTASVSAPSGGYIKYIKHLPGMFIKKGETLALIEDPQVIQLQQDYLLAKSNLSFAQKDLARQSDLNKNKAASDKVLQQVQTDAQNQNILMHSIAEKLRVMGIEPKNLSAGNIQRTIAVKSPVAGYVSSVNVKIGQYVSPTEKLFDIINREDIHLALTVFEKDLPKISVNQKVITYSNQNPNKKYVASILLIGKDFQPNRSVTVHCHFENEDESLLPGMFMNAEIETNSQEGLSVPDDAVVSWENNSYVFMETKPKTYKMIPVKIGNSENGITGLQEIPNALKKGKLVTKGAYMLLMGLKNIEE